MKTVNRRQWLQSSVTAAAGFPFLMNVRQTRAPLSGTDELRLNSNENPHGPSQKVLDAISASMSKGNLYPWNDKEVLRQHLSDFEGMPLDHIYIGAGSTEILQVAAMAFGLQRGKVVSCYPTFPVLMQKAADFSAEWLKLDLKDHHYDLQTMADHCDDKTSMVYICNPNNPTGTRLDAGELKQFAREISKRTMVFVDEAYIEFSEDGLATSLASMVRDEPNIIVARTFSKIYGMAGLRIGYAYAHPDTLMTMRKHRIGYGMNVPMTSLHAAMAALDDQDFVAYCRKENKKARDIACASFKEWEVHYVPSHTSFIYFKHDRFHGNLQKQLHARNILIRTYRDQPEYSRVSLGTVEQMEMFVDACKKILG